MNSIQDPLAIEMAYTDLDHSCLVAFGGGMACRRQSGHDDDHAAYSGNKIITWPRIPCNAGATAPKGAIHLCARQIMHDGSHVSNKDPKKLFEWS
jgi:hypothetical protein